MDSPLKVLYMTSCLDMILTITSMPDSWWIEVDHYLNRFGVTLFDKGFHERKLAEFIYNYW